jgi:predicted O-methyltransferase YrrM
MEDNNWTYAHNDTSVPERGSRTAALNKLKVSATISALREDAFAKQIPVATEETLNFILTLAVAKGAKSILEIGSAVGITALSLLDACKGAHITTIERDENFYNQAKVNLSSRETEATLYLGDALEIVPTLQENSFDFVFLDCAKVQYIKLLPHIKKLLESGGILLADDVLLYGYVNGEVPVPKKRKMLVQHIREYLTAVTEDEELTTSIIDIGDGLALSVKL